MTPQPPHTDASTTHGGTLQDGTTLTPKIDHDPVVGGAIALTISGLFLAKLIEAFAKHAAEAVVGWIKKRVKRKTLRRRRNPARPRASRRAKRAA